MSIEDELRIIRASIAKRIQERAHANVEVENAKVRLAALSQEVQEKFGVTDAAGLKAKLEELQQQYEAAVQKAKEQLAQASE
jgi:hypothetical protein